ncbi:hypothetical protein CRUP_018924 [Coryphaenoides rupestris]|nr:hypothetical protein CRUP_018924 [Coryphaenoides rupestris]
MMMTMRTQGRRMKKRLKKSDFMAGKLGRTSRDASAPGQGSDSPDQRHTLNGALWLHAYSKTSNGISSTVQGDLELASATECRLAANRSDSVTFDTCHGYANTQEPSTVEECDSTWGSDSESGDDSDDHHHHHLADLPAPLLPESASSSASASPPETAEAGGGSRSADPSSADVTLSRQVGCGVETLHPRQACRLVMVVVVVGYVTNVLYKPGNCSKTIEENKRVRTLNDSQQKSPQSAPKMKRSFYAARDLYKYRHSYPYKVSRQPNEYRNLRFYLNKIPLVPDGIYIEEILTKWRGDYDKLEHNHTYIQWSQHNYLRITRILKSLGELGYEALKAPLVQLLLEESLVHATLPNMRHSALEYYVYTIRLPAARRRLLRFARRHYRPAHAFLWGPPPKRREGGGGGGGGVNDDGDGDEKGGAGSSGIRAPAPTPEPQRRGEASADYMPQFPHHPGLLACLECPGEESPTSLGTKQALHPLGETH